MSEMIFSENFLWKCQVLMTLPKYGHYSPECEARCWRSHGATGRSACGTNARVHEITGLPLRSLDAFCFVG